MHSVAATSSARTHQPLRRKLSQTDSATKLPTSHRHARARPALCALQAFSFFSSERDEHGMRQALRLARMRAPRERRVPGAGRAQGRTGGMRDLYGGANRTRLWPRTKHLQPLLPATPTEHLWAGGCCGLGHRTSRLMRLYVYAVSRGRHVVADWGACVGTPVANLFSAFGDWNELRAVRPRENQLRTPGCPLGCLSHWKQVQRSCKVT